MTVPPTFFPSEVHWENFGEALSTLAQDAAEGNIVNLTEALAAIALSSKP